MVAAVQCRSLSPVVMAGLRWGTRGPEFESRRPDSKAAATGGFSVHRRVSVRSSRPGSAHRLCAVSVGQWTRAQCRARACSDRLCDVGGRRGRWAGYGSGDAGGDGGADLRVRSGRSTHRVDPPGSRRAAICTPRGHLRACRRRRLCHPADAATRARQHLWPGARRRSGAWWAGWESMTSWTVVGTAAVGYRRTARPAGGVHALDGCQGSFVTAVAGDRHRLVYSIIRSAEGDDSTCVDRPGLTARVVGRQARPLRGVPGGWWLAVTGPGWPLLTSQVRWRSEALTRGTSRPRSVSAARPSRSPSVPTTPRRSFEPETPRGSRSAIWATGQLRGTVTLRGRAGPDLSAAERRVVYSMGARSTRSTPAR